MSSRNRRQAKAARREARVARKEAFAATQMFPVVKRRDRNRYSFEGGTIVDAVARHPVPLEPTAESV